VAAANKGGVDGANEGEVKGQSWLQWQRRQWWRTQARQRKKSRWRQGGSTDGEGRDTCHNCSKVGHWARDCQSKAKEEAHAAHDDESALLLLEAGDVTVKDVSPSPPATPPKTLSGADEPVLPKGDEIDYVKFPKTPPHTAEIVHLVEDEVYIQFGEEKKECRRWVLDTAPPST
jgi:hypothetical protein